MGLGDFLNASAIGEWQAGVGVGVWLRESAERQSGASRMCRWNGGGARERAGRKRYGKVVVDGADGQRQKCPGIGHQSKQASKHERTCHLVWQTEAGRQVSRPIV